MKVYKRSIIAFLWNLLSAIFGTILVFMVVGYFFDIKPAMIAAGLIALWLFKGVWDGLRLEVMVDEYRLIIKEGGKQSEFVLDEIKVSGTDIDHNDLTLYVYYPDEAGREQRKSFDISFLGVMKYHQLMEELQERTGFAVIRLQADKKEEL